MKFILKVITIRLSGLVLFIVGGSFAILVYSHNGYIVRPLERWFNSLVMAEFWHILLGFMGFIFIILPVCIIPILIPLIGLMILVMSGDD
jgi:hypothetical protein